MRGALRAFLDSAKTIVGLNKAKIAQEQCVNDLIELLVEKGPNSLVAIYPNLNEKLRLQPFVIKKIPDTWSNFADALVSARHEVYINNSKLSVKLSLVEAACNHLKDEMAANPQLEKQQVGVGNNSLTPQALFTIITTTEQLYNLNTRLYPEKRKPKCGLFI